MVLKYFLVRQPKYQHGGSPMSKDNNSLAHTTWNCKYYIVFAPKYRRQIINGKIKKILEKYCANYVKEKV
jgi:putative transposase